MTTVVGFIGLGQIGAPMAERLVDVDGPELLVYDVRQEAYEPFSNQRVSVTSGSAEMARISDVISVMVRDDEQVRDVVRPMIPGARPGLVVAIHSTIHPRTAEELAAELAPHDVTVVDAPVAGGFIGAAHGNLAVMIGGPAEAVERCRGPFGRWAGLIVHLGPVGAATRAKLARNLLQFATYAAAAEAQRLAEAAGVDLMELAKVVRHSDKVTGGPGAIMLRPTTAPMRKRDPLYDILSHTRDLGEKDLRLALELGSELGVDLPFSSLALDRLAAGLGLEDAR